MDKALPPLPGSDVETLRSNKYDTYYKKTSKQVWGDSAIEHRKMEEPRKCEHNFEKREESIFCTKCHMGLNGAIKLKEGQAYIGSKKLL